MKKTVWKYGLISGGILSLFTVLTLVFWGDKMMDSSYGMLVGYAGMVLAFVFILLGVKKYRDTVGEGRISFGRGFGLGLLIMLVASLCYTTCWTVYVFAIDPEWIERFVDCQSAMLEESGLSPEKLEEKLDEMARMSEWISNPVFFFLFGFTEPFLPGIVMSLISGLVWKKKD